MKNKGKINLVLDFVMFLAMLGLFFIKGESHETLAYSLGGLLILHIVLHWQQIKVMYRQLLPETSHRVVGGAVMAVLIAAILTMPMYLPAARERNHGKHGPPPGNYEHFDRD
ncbi:MAG: hypothetical protein GXY34_04520 [Syntrophomonadaceae bacterium]|nr:hypothetical protein [Syntrophomonadaceae bacterium]